MQLVLTISILSIMITSCEARSYKNTLKSHKWQNRLLMVIADDTSNINFQKQIESLQSHKEDLIERKLLVYKALPTLYIKGLENTNLESSNELYKKYNPKSAPFKVVLIGLDGRVKLKQTEILTIEKLNGIIDSMPMRMKEMRRNK